MTTYPWVIWKYLAKNFISWFLSVSIVLSSIVSVFEIVELFRRGSGKSYISFILILKMVFLKLPVVMEQIFPLIIFFSCFLCFRSLNQKLELVTIRASGLSMIQIVLPFLGVIVAFSALYLLILNPLASSMFSRFEHLENKLFKPQQDTLSIVKSGLWFKKKYDKGQVIIHSKKALKETLALKDITLYFFDKDNKFSKRLDSPEAFIKENKLILKKPWIAKNKQWSEQEQKDKTLTIALSLLSLEKNVKSPKSIPFYKLPQFINSMEEMGFSVIAHRVHWYRLLGSPFLYLAMVLWASFFSLRWQRQEKAIKEIGFSCIAVFSLYILSEVMRSLGLSGALSPGWSVILSVGLIFFSGCSFLLHLQER